MIKNIKTVIKRKLRTYRNRILKRINKVIEFFKLKTKGITIESTSYVTRPIYFISIIVLISVIINQKVNKSDEVVILQSSLDSTNEQIILLQTHTDELQSQLESSEKYTIGLESDLGIYLSTLSDLKRYNADLEEQLTTAGFVITDLELEIDQIQKDLDLADAWIKSHIELIEQ